MIWFVSLVVSAATSLRGASRVLAISMSLLQLPWAVPSWYTGRLWLLRVGYYKLTRPKAQADDWVWIVDHTMQLGVEKGLVILGIRLSAIPPPGQCLQHEDVEPLALFPVKKSNGEVVYQQLEETVKHTGVPRQIIGDQGSDLASGIEKFRQEHRETCYIYDIKHKTAAVLKHVLHEDETWRAFTQLTVQTKHKIQQTACAFLAPPNQRTKARYMNVEVLIRWGRKTLTFFDTQPLERWQGLDQELLEAQVGWICGFRAHLHEWGELLQIIEVTESFVRTHGLYRDAHRDLQDLLAPLARAQRTKKVQHHLLAFVAEQSFQAKPNERLLGSSEVIESVFGTLKRLEHDQAKSGFTGLLLGIGAVVSPTTPEVVHKALATVTTKDVLDWRNNTLGQSVQAKRRAAFTVPDKTEQKWDQFEEAI